MSWLCAKRQQSRAIGTAAVLSVMLAVVAGCGDAQDAVTQDAGTVAGRVVSLTNNAPVGGATVKTERDTETTAADGTFSVTASAGDRAIVRVEANGFADAFSVARVRSGQISQLGIKLVPIGSTTTVSVASGDTVLVPNSAARLTIPANSLVPRVGGTPAGSVTVSLTPLNPAEDTSLMPGGFNGISAGGGSTRPIESFGALLIDIRDIAGTRYNLAQGKTATIRIPLGTQSSNPPSTVPLWFFDETTGVWREEGTATLQGSDSNQFYEGDITRITYWNADQVLETIVVNGCVKDANGRLVTNAVVKTEGIDYTGTAADVTAADGTFSVAMRKSGQANLRVVEFDPQTFALVPTSNIVKIGPSATDISLTNCLVKQPGPLAITTAALPAGKVGVAYNQTLAASGGVPGYRWILNTGSNPLPAGLELNPFGVISGTPTTDGTMTITIKVTDSTGATTTKEFTLVIQTISQPPPPPPPTPPLTITTTGLPGGTVGTAYSAPLASAGGTGTKSWSISAGILPAGLSLNAATGVISGTPTAATSSILTVRVQDSGTPQQSAEQPLIITIITSGNGGGSTGGGSGQLTVSNAPSSVGGKFIPTTNNQSNSLIQWWESDTHTHTEGFSLFQHNLPQVTFQLVFVAVDIDPSNFSQTSSGWSCTFPAVNGSPFDTCNGVEINQVGGTLTLTNTVLSPGDGVTQSVTLNGTLTFTPF